MIIVPGAPYTFRPDQGKHRRTGKEITAEICYKEEGWGRLIHLKPRLGNQVKQYHISGQQCASQASTEKKSDAPDQGALMLLEMTCSLKHRDRLFEVHKGFEAAQQIGKGPRGE